MLYLKQAATHGIGEENHVFAIAAFDCISPARLSRRLHRSRGDMPVEISAPA